MLQPVAEGNIDRNRGCGGMVDTPDSKPGAEKRGGSSPSIRTKTIGF